jgi:hypothetical protein
MKKQYLFIIIFVFLFASAGLTQNNNRNHKNGSALIKVIHSELGWTDTRLTEKLLIELSRNGNGGVVNADVLTEMPEFPAGQYETDSLIDWAARAGRKYLVLVTVEFEGLQRKKTFNVPLIFHKYQNIGVIYGELRVVDIMRKRNIVSEHFKIEREGKRIFQASIDDDKNDADLHISAPEKILFFRELERELAVILADKIREATNLR